MPTDTPITDDPFADDFGEELDDALAGLTVSVNGGPEHPADSLEASAELQNAATDALGATITIPAREPTLPGMPAKPTIVRAGRDIDHVKLNIKATDQFKANHPRIISLANALRMDAPVRLACNGIVTGENVTQKVTKDGDVEYVLTITVELQPLLDELERAANLPTDAFS